MFLTINIVTPAEGKQERASFDQSPVSTHDHLRLIATTDWRQVQGMLGHLCAEVEKHEPEAIMFCASWCAAAGVFYVVEIRFANEAAQEHHRNQPYTAELRRISQAEHNLAKKVEVQVLDRFAGFNRGY
ncbi:geranylgeranyl pyrophosphate synthetase [Apiospora aurea]|uniref:Geranylgeranyl pyrophosphate synthetase n=1 Tax=Apiospora aurea TaxID=335848 RepID=A0ABR1QA97_9PEZI